MKAVKVPVQICGLISIVSEVEKHVPEPYALRNDQRQGPRITRFTQMLRELQYPFTADLDQDQVTLLILSAEREIAAYRNAVLDLYGTEASDWATNDWLSALETTNWPACRSGLSWRTITILSASRLAMRLCAVPGK
jgi:hypothetical protein